MVRLPFSATLALFEFTNKLFWIRSMKVRFDAMVQMDVNLA